MQIKWSLALAATACASLAAGAACHTDGIGTQSVYLSVEGKKLDRHQLRLPGGFELGILIEPATTEKYREGFARHNLRGSDELVKITLLDMAAVPPTSLSTTWGGANSRQGFGPRGGANGVPQLRDQIELYFHKPVCVTPETLSQQK